MNSENNEKLDHSILRAYFFHPDFSEKLMTKHLQLHLSYFYDNQYGNSIKRAIKPNRLFRSLDSLYL